VQEVKMTRYITAEEAADQLQRRLAELAPGWMIDAPDLQQRLVSVLADEPRQLLATMRFDEYLTWLDTDTYAEWEDGKVVMMSPASMRHVLISSFLVALLAEYVLRYQLGTVLSAPFQMMLRDLRRSREPDVLFVAGANQHRLRDTYLDGPADFVIEIVSPESVTRDRITKFQEYAQAGIPEYWIVDPLIRSMVGYQLFNGAYAPIEPENDGRLYSAVLPGFWILSDWLWQEPLPSVVTTLEIIAAT
jgi:Uma2 family endonuclease